MVSMCLQGITAVVFDLDDTLCSERQFVESGFRAVSAYVQERGITAQALFPDMWRRFCGGSRGRIFDDSLRAAGVVPDDALIAELVDVYRSHIPSISLYPDARAVLSHFYGRRQLGLLTDGYLQTQHNKVRALKIEDFFDVLVFTDQMGRRYWKPDTAGYRRIMAELNVPGAACLYVGDNPGKDFFGANRLGWQTVQICRPGGIYAGETCESSDYQADVTISDLSRLLELVA